MNDPAFFGYGSLVNLATHTYPNPRPAQLQGWQRVWRFTTQRAEAFLSVEPAKDVAIDGIVANVPGGDWAALDLRETGYDRHDVSGHWADMTVPTAVYAVSPQVLRPHDGHQHILRSYLDVVVQGFLRVYDENAAQRFFHTTIGWDTFAIVDDRAAPRYPRAQVLTADETAFVDAAIARL